jgi:hypothetical protein
MYSPGMNLLSIRTISFGVDEVKVALYQALFRPDSRISVADLFAGSMSLAVKLSCLVVRYASPISPECSSSPRGFRELKLYSDAVPEVRP